MRKDRTFAQEQERKRLAAIENPGRCQSRMTRIDGWCQKFPMIGLDVCFKHGGRFAHSRKAAEERKREAKVQSRAASIVKRARK
jgi:hypothetical protein